jgi:UDP-glucose 4-epimerase
MLKDIFLAQPSWKISILRYFNPIGAHLSGMIGDSPEHPLNLLPYIQKVAIGQKPYLDVFGNNWNTPDGTGK